MDLRQLVLVSDGVFGGCSPLVRALGSRQIRAEAALEGDVHGRAKASRPSLIILDVAQPVDGKTQLLRLRQDPDTAHIPVVVVNAADSRGRREEYIRLGAVDFADQPLDETFVERIARLVVGLSLVPGVHAAVW